MSILEKYYVQKVMTRVSRPLTIKIRDFPSRKYRRTDRSSWNFFQ